jgi:hypothetical protein
MEEHDSLANAQSDGEAVVRPGRIDGRNLVSDQVGEQIVRFVAQRPDDIPLGEIEAVPPLLSLVCERLNTANLEAKPPQEEISDELVKSQGTDILQRFYDESFAAFPDLGCGVAWTAGRKPLDFTFDKRRRFPSVRENRSVLTSRAGFMVRCHAVRN